MDINSLPSVSQSDMQAMVRNAEKMASQEGIVVPHPDIQKEAQMVVHPERVPQTSFSQQPNWQLQAPIEPEPIAEEEHVQESTESESSYQPPAEQTAPSMARRKTPAESFSELKAAKERAERERDDMYRRYYEREQSNQTLKQPSIQQTEEDLNFKIADDDLPNGEIVNKVDKKVKRLEDELRQFQQQSALAATESRIKSQYQDFDKVVSKDNLDLLAYTYPELATTLNSTSDLYSKAVSAYTMIKNLGIHKEYVPNAESKRIEQNINKPRLSPAVSAQQGSALSKANAFAEGLTPDLQAQLMREMRDSRRNY
jgi:hypothetical protein